MPHRRSRLRELVWYASYGSNLSYQKRFIYYIKGGTPFGSHTRNPGCRDKTLPLDNRPIMLNFELFFAGHFSSWGGTAAAFIRRGAATSSVIGRMYLVTYEQFNDVLLQENGKRVNGARLVPPFEQLAHGRDIVLAGIRPYGRLLSLGKQDGYPIVTFTVTKNDDLPIDAPSESYVKIIVSGIKGTCPSMDNREICEYLLGADGIKNRIQSNLLARWVAESTGKGQPEVRKFPEFQGAGRTAKRLRQKELTQ